jgi:hypothetical protein
VKNCLNVFPFTHHPYAFAFIAFPCVLPAQNIATFDGVYHANQPSLGSCFPLLSFISVVPDLFAYVNPLTLKLLTHELGRFAESESIFRNKNATHSGMICCCCCGCF